jgi:hypothetical protein
MRLRGDRQKDGGQQVGNILLCTKRGRDAADSLLRGVISK